MRIILPWYRESLAAAAMVTVLCGASGAQADDARWYVGANLPLMFIDDSESISSGSSRPGSQEVNHRATVRTEHGTGFKFGGVLGYRFASGFRFEGEFFLARAKVDKLTHTNITASLLPGPIQQDLRIPVSGSAGQFGAMLNLWHSLDLGSPLVPYFGGGLGFIRVDQGGVKYDTNAVAQAVADELARLQGATAPRLPDGFVPELSPTDIAFAYQIGAGIEYPLSDSTSLEVGYRLQNIDSLAFSGREPLRFREFEHGPAYTFSRDRSSLPLLIVAPELRLAGFSANSIVGPRRPNRLTGEPPCQIP